MKHTAKKTRRLYQDKVIAGFAGSTADAISLFERFEASCRNFLGICESGGGIWRKIGAKTGAAPPGSLLIVAAPRALFFVGNGDVIEPDDGIVAIGSGALDALARHAR